MDSRSGAAVGRGNDGVASGNDGRGEGVAILCGKADGGLDSRLRGHDGVVREGR